jgi:prepilin-type N-terminal cleavage/methylation domain-containing protein/prepilin-type processing-associated H-X9-DG protein
LRRAFTLIEVLVAITIVLIVSAITFGVVVNVKERAKVTGCLANERQIAAALLMYIQDYDEVMPVGSQFVSWPVQVEPYLGSAMTKLHCPAYSRGRYLSHGEDATGYSLNACLVGAPSIPNPSLTVLVTESADAKWRSSSDFGPVIMLAWPDALAYPAFCERMGRYCNVRLPYGARRHNERSHYTFADSHTKLLPPERIRISSMTNEGRCPTSEQELTGSPGDPAFPLVP